MASIHEWLLELEVEEVELGVALEVGGDALDALDELLWLEEEMEEKRLGFLGARVCGGDEGILERVFLLMK